MNTLGVLEGSAGLRLDEVAHVMVPGRARSTDGMDISDRAIVRVESAADFYIDRDLERNGGVIVVSGYKTPRDKAGEVWRSPDTGEEFVGIPEAYSMQFRLIARGIGQSAIKVEAHSIDTVSNFARAEGEGHFPDDRPTAIVAQREHLERMLEVIAPRTLRREYLGIVAPEYDPEAPDEDSALARLVSRMEVAGYRPETKDLLRKTERRAHIIWGIVGLLRV